MDSPVDKQRFTPLYSDLGDDDGENVHLTIDEKIAVVDDGKLEQFEQDGEHGEDRGSWSGQLDFLMSLIAYAVGLGNVWRFPYLCYKNGGGAFLIPYAICWLVGAVPIFFLEVAAGQFLQRGGLALWKVCPIFTGVGIANMMISFFCVIYYNIIVSWALYYLFSSFQSVLPWITCGNWWNDNSCVPLDANLTNVTFLDTLKRLGVNLNDTQTPVEQFWENKVLETSASIGEFSHVQWQLLLILVLSYIMVYFALWKGIVNARKVVYFCAISPYILLFILLGRGASLPGASVGIAFYLTPNMTMLTEMSVWKDAGTQVFYSYGIGFGALMALGSYNKYNHNCYRDVFALCIVNAVTSIMAGFVVFAVLGFMAHEAGKTIHEVVKAGVGLVFLVYPEVVASLPISQLWSVLFFVMIAILGMDSQVCMVEAIMTPLKDQFQWVRRNKELTMFILCVCSFVLGLTMITGAGQYWLTLIDAFGASGFTLLFIVFFEVVGLSWGFGADRIYKALEDMLGFRPCFLWKYCWMFTAPILCSVIFVLTAIYYEPLKYADDSPYPNWAMVIGFLMSASSMSVIPIVAVYIVFTTPGTSLWDKFRKSFKPTVPIRFGSNRSNKEVF